MLMKTVMKVVDDHLFWSSKAISKFVYHTGTHFYVCSVFVHNVISKCVIRKYVYDLYKHIINDDRFPLLCLLIHYN